MIRRGVCGVRASVGYSEEMSLRKINFSSTVDFLRLVVLVVIRRSVREPVPPPPQLTISRCNDLPIIG